MSGRLTIDNLSNELKVYLQTLGISEDRVVELINDNIPQDLIDRVDNVEVSVGEVRDSVTETDESVEDLKGSITSLTNEIKAKDEIITSLSNTVDTLQNKLIDIMIYLNMMTNEGINSSGQWYDDLSTGDNITFIEGIVLDVDRRRIMGASGNVIFKQIDVPFSCDKVRIAVDFDNNFIEAVSDFTTNIGDTEIVIDNYVYKVE